MSALLRYMILDEDGQRIGRFESTESDWGAGDIFELDGRRLRIVEILPEVSTMVTYNEVWVAALAVIDEIDGAATVFG